MTSYVELTELLLSYSDTKAEIAFLKAKNQNAPGYLHQQAADLKDSAIEMAADIDGGKIDKR